MSAETAAERLKKAGRNDACPCGSGKKYKKCHLAEDEAAAHAEFSRQQAAVRAAEERAAEEQAAEGGEQAEATGDKPAPKVKRAGKAKPQPTPSAGRAAPRAKNLPRRRAV